MPFDWGHLQDPWRVATIQTPPHPGHVCPTSRSCASAHGHAGGGWWRMVRGLRWSEPNLIGRAFLEHCLPKRHRFHSNVQLLSAWLFSLTTWPRKLQHCQHGIESDPNEARRALPFSRQKQVFVHCVALETCSQKFGIMLGSQLLHLKVLLLQALWDDGLWLGGPCSRSKYFF